MDVTQRITGPIITQGDEFLGLSDARGERDAAGLILALSGQGKGGDRITLGEDHDGLAAGDLMKAAKKAKWIRPRHEQVRKSKPAAALGKKLMLHDEFAFRRNWRDGQVRPARTQVSENKPAPPVVA